MFMTRVIPIVAILLMAGPVAALAQDGVQSQSPSGLRDLQVAFFSPQRVFSESADGKAAQARLGALQTEKAKAVDEKNKALQAQQQALEQSGTILSDQARAQRTKELDRFKIDVQRFIEDAQAELMGVQRDIESAFLAKLRPAIAQVAKEKKLQLVLNADEGAIAWIDPSLDITADIVKRMAAAPDARIDNE